MTSLVLAEHDNRTLSPVTAQAVAAAKQLGADVHVLVAGHDCFGVAAAASRLDGVETVFIADDPQYTYALAEPLAELVLSLTERYDTFVAPATASGNSVMPRVAAILDVPQVSAVTKILARDTFERPTYAGRIIQTVQVSTGKVVLTIRPSAFFPVGEGAATNVLPVLVPKDPALSMCVKEVLTVSDRPDIATAKIVVAGGRGLQAQPNFDCLARIAELLDAAVGGTRAAVDGGFLPNHCQIGQTGKIVAPDLYIGVGVSGAIQHMAGIKDAKVIVAINTDEDAPIFDAADFGLVADASKALSELESGLIKREQGMVAGRTLSD